MFVQPLTLTNDGSVRNKNFPRFVANDDTTIECSMKPVMGCAPRSSRLFCWHGKGVSDSSFSHRLNRSVWECTTAFRDGGLRQSKRLDLFCKVNCTSVIVPWRARSRSTNPLSNGAAFAYVRIE